MCTVHVAKTDGEHTTLRPGSCVLLKSRNPMSSIRLYSRRRAYCARHYTRWLSYHSTSLTGACCAGRETRLRQYDTAPKRRACCARRKWPPYYDTTCLVVRTVHVAKLDAVLRHYARASSVLFKSRWWPYDSTSGVVCTVQVAEFVCVNKTRRPNVVPTLHVGKSHLIHMTVRFYFFSWSVL